jgi:hypothetical protein
MTDVRIDDFDDLDHLARALDRVGDQARQLADFVGSWVCQPDAFRTSNACLLQPLAPAVDAVAGAFDDFVRGFGSDWRALADGVLTTRRDLADADQQVLAALLKITR